MAAHSAGQKSLAGRSDETQYCEQTLRDSGRGDLDQLRFILNLNHTVQ